MFCNDKLTATWHWFYANTLSLIPITTCIFHSLITYFVVGVFQIITLEYTTQVTMSSIY